MLMVFILLIYLSNVILSLINQTETHYLHQSIATESACPDPHPTSGDLASRSASLEGTLCLEGWWQPLKENGPTSTLLKCGRMNIIFEHRANSLMRKSAHVIPGAILNYCSENNLHTNWQWLILSGKEFPSLAVLCHDCTCI
ncbi:hypothetical protein ACQKWADRAFT_301294 [Trichoderma austrokoningii]